MIDKGLCGLNNLGNTCYLNSILQCLFHCKKFIIFILDCKNKLIEGLLYEFCEMIDDIWFSDKEIITPVQFFEQLRENNIFYRNNNQQDSHECLLTLLDNFEKDIVSNNILHKTDNSLWSTVFKEKYNFIHDIFYGLYETQITCSNNHISIIKEPFIDISLPIIKNINNITELINNIEKTEVLEDNNKYFCDICKDYICAEKKTFIRELPKYNLIIHLKRFENNCQKINDYIDYPYCLKIKDTQYNLFGVVNHIGNQIGGHYYSYIKHIDNNWYEINDSSVTQIYDHNKIINSDAYILFYQLE